MTGRIIYRPTPKQIKEPHKCDHPLNFEYFDMNEPIPRLIHKQPEPIGTIWQCDECGWRWTRKITFRGFDPEWVKEWRLRHWWHGRDWRKGSGIYT